MVYKMLNNVGVVQRRVHAQTLRHLGEVLVKLSVLPVRHELCGHDDLPSHQVAELHEEAVGVALENLRAELLVRLLVPSLVSGDFGADPLQVPGAVLAGDPADVSVGDLRGALLEGRVEKSSVEVLLGSGVESRRDEVLDGDLDGPEVALAGQVEVLVEEVAVAVLLGSPSARPSRPRAVGCAGRVVAPLEGVQERLVGREGLLRDHVADEDDEQIVGTSLRGLAKVLDVLFPIPLGHVWEIVLRLPRLFAGLE
mmetsp:Transcript_36501/g.87028  ORF Transcript_36501/g.87028 Transcript_36501/m.87028 type:complete len:254 (-) Transcript_36501:557-1318(-)